MCSLDGSFCPRSVCPMDVPLMPGRLSGYLCTRKMGWVEQADRRLENQSTGPLSSHRVWPLLTSLPFSHRKRGEGILEGQSTNPGPAPNPHHPLSNRWHPKTERG